MDNNPKSQVVERLREAQNVLITVSNNPSVDQLAAAIGLTLMMNKLDKHATAVFSGSIPSTIEFLKPEDTLEQNTDSLRDFIISLDKAKADKLRYKVEEDVVKIFITPYKTSLSQSDLDFSQGDFNVDVVIALGVDQRDHIDQAIMAHGRILHDATVIGIMAGNTPVDVGSINWQEPAASSLSEMLVNISEAFQSGLLDSQMATAFLTGIVAETERFSNEKTTPKVMTMSAQLMAAGANQQLIATKLAIPTEVDDGVPADLPPPAAPIQTATEGVLSLHEEHMAEQVEQAAEVSKPEEPVVEFSGKIDIDSEGTLKTAEELAKVVTDVQAAAKPADATSEKPKYSTYMTEPPKMGGTLTASGADDVVAEPSTDPLSAIPQAAYPILGTKEPVLEPLTTVEAPITDNVLTQNIDTSQDRPLGPEITDSSTLTDIESAVEDYTGEQVHAEEPEPIIDHTEAARKAVEEAVMAGGYNAERPTPLESIGAQPLSADEFTPPQPEQLEQPQNDAQSPPSSPPPLPLPAEDTNPA